MKHNASSYFMSRHIDPGAWITQTSLLTHLHKPSVAFTSHRCLQTERLSMCYINKYSRPMELKNMYLVLVIATAAQLSKVAFADDTSTLDEVNLASDEIARLRKFNAEKLKVATLDGYLINVVHIFPVSEGAGKRPVIFNHGTTQSSTYFMTNSVGARPKNLTNLDAGSMSQDELETLLLHDPAARCLPLLLANFGHHVFLIDRRGTEYSLGKVGGPNISSLFPFGGGKSGRQVPPSSGDLLASTPRFDQLLEPLLRNRSADEQSSGLLSLLGLLLRPQYNLGSIFNTFDSNYWAFSMDEQAKFDVPAVIEFVLKLLNVPKVAYVGHSIGNGLMFMLQSEQPEWADKVEPFLAWSPDFYLGGTAKTSLATVLLGSLEPIMRRTQMPFPPPAVTPLTRTLLATLCITKLAQRSVCLILENSQWGNSINQTETLPAFVASQFYTVSSHEAAQFAQNANRGKMYHFDFATKEKNRAVYGRDEPPIYNVSRITSKSISLWRGLADGLATPANVELLKKDLSVSVDDRVISQTPFNHYDILFGRDNARLVMLPSLKVIQSYK